MTATSRRCLSWAAACAAVGMLVLTGIPMLFGSPRPLIQITWRDVGPAERHALERALQLAAPTPLGGAVWVYEAIDTSTEALRAIVTHQSVADTEGINRRTLTFASALSPRRGGLLWGAPAWAAGVAKLFAGVLFGVAAAAFMLLRESLAHGHLVSPLRLRVAWAALLANPVVQLSAWSSRVRGWMQRGVPTGSAEATGLFRIVFGTAVLVFVAMEPANPALLDSYDAVAAEGAYGAMVRWLGAYPAVPQGLGVWLNASGVLFIAGVSTPVSFACFVLGFLVWAAIFTLTTSTHAVAVLGLTLICLLSARWGDAWSIDALLGRALARPRRQTTGGQYGYVFWIPRLTLGLAFLAAAWSKIAGGPGWILNGTVKYHFISELDPSIGTRDPRPARPPKSCLQWRTDGTCGQPTAVPTRRNPEPCRGPDRGSGLPSGMMQRGRTNVTLRLMVHMLRSFVVVAILAGAVSAQQVPQESDFLSTVRRLTVDGRRAGEGYWAPDGQRLVFQSEREPGNPFYQIYTLDFGTGDTTRISPGHGKTTCAFFRPGSDQILFASTHHDPQSRALQQAELDFRASGQERRYAWDYDPEFDIYAASERSGELTRLTDARGYDAEASYSPDGAWIVFSSMRDAYDRTLTDPEQRQLDIDPSYFAEIYIMRADGSDQRRLTDVIGYDGGPFFSPDGTHIVWRRFDAQGLIADVWTMRPDGTEATQVTDFAAMSWAPYIHPSGEYLLFASNKLGFENFEVFMADVDGMKEPVRVTYSGGFDGLPVPSPDGRRLAWTSSRGGGREGQLFLADWNHERALAALRAAPNR